VTALLVARTATRDGLVQRETFAFLRQLLLARFGQASERAIFGNFRAEGVVGLGDTERHAAKATISSELARE
jgi:hypothetical protein